MDIPRAGWVFRKNVFILQKISRKMCARWLVKLRKMCYPVFNRNTGSEFDETKRGYRKDGRITNIPLYLAGKTKELL